MEEKNNATPKVIAFVPIKFESQRLKNKNFLNLGGHPLCYHIFETLLKIPIIDKVYVYCSQEEIKNLIPDQVHFLKRSSDLDGNSVLGMEIYQEFAKEIQADIYVLAHATSPLLSTTNIMDGLNSIIYRNFDSSFSAVKEKTYVWHKNQPLNYQLDQVVRTQDLEPIIIETSGFYMYRKEVLEKGQRIGDNPHMVMLNKIEAIDIDLDDDYLLAQSVLSYQNNQKALLRKEDDIQKNTQTKSAIFNKTRNIKLIVFDFDGCLSDGSIYLDYKGRVIKNYYTLDGEAIVKAVGRNYKVGIMSGNDLDFFKKKAKKWKLEFFYGEIHDKLLKLKYLSYQAKIPLDEIAFFGDGLNDIKVLKAVGFSGCPANAHPNTKKVVDYVTTEKGGHGAINEFLSLFP